MLQKTILAFALCTTLSGCAYAVAGGAGYIIGRELEEQQGKDEPEVYK